MTSNYGIIVHTKEERLNAASQHNFIVDHTVASLIPSLQLTILQVQLSYILFPPPEIVSCSKTRIVRLLYISSLQSEITNLQFESFITNHFLLSSKGENSHRI